MYSLKVLAWTCLQVQKEFEDPRREIEICKLKKDGQHNGQKKKGKRPNNHLQNNTHKTIDRVQVRN